MLFKEQDLIRFEDYEIVRSRWSLRWRNKHVALSRKTFDLLLYLIDNRERVVSKEELLNALWPGQFVEPSNLTQHIFLLRRDLSHRKSSRKLIETIASRGYRFTAEVYGDEQNHESVPVDVLRFDATADTPAETNRASLSAGSYPRDSRPVLAAD